MATITKDTIIGDILDIAPETAPVFLSIGCTAWAVPLPAGRLWNRPAWSMAWMLTLCWRRSTRWCPPQNKIVT